VKTIPIVGKPYVQREALRAIVNRLWAEPGHFYSPIPDVAEVQHKAESVFHSDRELPGIDLRCGPQLALLEELRTYQCDMPFTENRQSNHRFFFENPAFSYCDALLLYSLIRHYRPKRIVEVGCGYSSCVILDTNERFFQNSIESLFIEPYPDLLYSLIKENDRASITVLRQPLQDVSLEPFERLQAGDILFIDSSHVIKTQSDVNWVLFEILPRLTPGVLIHIHDVFYPFEYPPEWVYQGRAWNEAYAVRAFLQFNV